MIYCSLKYCCSNSSIPGVISHSILHSIMKSIKTPNHPAYHWSTLWLLEVWVRGLYNSWWFCVHKLSMFIYLSMFFMLTEIYIYIFVIFRIKHNNYMPRFFMLTETRCNEDTFEGLYMQLFLGNWTKNNNDYRNFKQSN